jgi:hypothetical protein
MGRKSPHPKPRKETNMTLQEAIQEVREHYYASIAEAITNSPDMSYAEIGRMVGCSENLVWNVARLRGLSRTAKPMSGDKEPGSTKCQ